ncbi:hypothetical protein QWZ10_06220 [Paracoccus cavernae]|uniref:FCD domain-containing protein n=1 Tax=Paracoccus cavernae TaxID=1571207 RepID=A0ABT8D4B2_9RHOB|nr:hypothetical protein [Paracoccus cavernae]
MQTLADPEGQAAHHQSLVVACRRDPEKRAAMSRHLEKGKSHPPAPLRLVHAGPAQTQRHARIKLRVGVRIGGLRFRRGKVWAARLRHGAFSAADTNKSRTY